MSIFSKLNLSSKDKRALVLCAVVLGAIFLFLGVISPKLEEIRRLDNQIKNERLDLQKVRDLRAALDALGKRQDLAQEQLQRRKQENFSIASVIEGMAREAKIQDNVQYLKPDQAKFSDQYREASVSLKVTEITPEQLVDFLYRIESSERLLRLRSLQIRNHSKSPGKLDATLKVFTLLPSQESA